MQAIAEPLRIVYPAIGLMYRPLWVTQEAGIFKKRRNLDTELVYISGGVLSSAALICIRTIRAGGRTEAFIDR